MSYPVITGPESLKEISKFISGKSISSVFILVDSNTRQFCLPILLSENSTLNSAHIIEIPAGESEKIYSNCENIIAVFLKKYADRNSLLINVGGGVITDLGGFTASIYKRGIEFINVPTTLLAMADASLGGKTGINFQEKKNVIGTFSDPSQVLIYPSFLKTLSPREIRSGYSEIFKHIIISDRNKFNTMLNDPENCFQGNNLTQLIEDSVKFKMSVIEEDYKETGKRKILNFGHTFGHALESISQKGVRPLSHGEAIAAGMTGELLLSNRLAGFPESQMYAAIHFLRNIYSDIHLRFTPDDIYPYLLADKKNSKEQVAFSLLSSPGKPAGIFYPSREAILEGLNFLIYEFSSTTVQ